MHEEEPTNAMTVAELIASVSVSAKAHWRGFDKCKVGERRWYAIAGPNTIGGREIYLVFGPRATGIDLDVLISAFYDGTRKAHRLSLEDTLP